MTPRFFTARADDIFVASYPRSGTTWLQMIVLHLLRPGVPPFGHISDLIPFLDPAIRRGDHFDDRPSPRLFKTHLPRRHVAGWPGRWVYIARDGRDVAVSYFNFHRSYLGLEEPFEAFFGRFLRGQLLYGSWFAHVAGWRSAADDTRVLFLTYEQLVSDFDAVVARLASFLGVVPTADATQRLTERCSFASMRAMEHRFEPITERSLESGDTVRNVVAEPGSFVRKGRVGSWKHVLTPDQARRFADAVACAA